VNEDLLKAGNAFSKWGPREVEVLDSLPKCGSLLAWLRTNIRDRSDLKTFYDLATIAAGESDHELDRVTHFYQAMCCQFSGFSRIIRVWDYLFLKISILKSITYVSWPDTGVLEHIHENTI
jgi:hypothetical protein